MTATSVPTGFTITNIVNTNGTVTADVGATCLAERTNFITLQVSNGSLTNNAPLFVVINAPEANVKGNGVSISDGASSPNTGDWTDFGIGSGNSDIYNRKHRQRGAEYYQYRNRRERMPLTLPSAASAFRRL